MARSDYHHLYNRAAWRKGREAHLRLYPLCRMCFALGQYVAATVVDHIKPHKGDEVLFYDRSNWQSLCKPCHDGHKQAQEHSADGLLRGAGHDGRPLDLAHPWHRPVAAAGGRGGEISAALQPQTGPVPPFAEPRNPMGGSIHA